jgi:plasmid stability protein
MATLYVEDVPQELYEALRRRARERHRSIAAEVLSLLEENIPTAKELEMRRNLLQKLEKMPSSKSVPGKPFPSTEEMQREDRGR